MHSKRLSRQGRLYLNLLLQCREARMQSQNAEARPQPCLNKGWRVCNCRNLDPNRRKSKLSPIYITSNSLQLGAGHKDWKSGYFLLDFISERCLSVLEKEIPDCETGQDLFKGFTFQRDKQFIITKDLQLHVFCFHFILF